MAASLLFYVCCCEAAACLYVQGELQCVLDQPWVAGKGVAASLKSQRRWLEQPQSQTCVHKLLRLLQQRLSNPIRIARQELKPIMEHTFGCFSSTLQSIVGG